MSTTRNQALDALLAKLVTISTFKTTGRRVKLWSEVDAADQPAMFLADHREHRQPRPRGLPNKLTLDCMLFIYLRVGDDPALVPSVAINNYLPLIDAVIKPDNMNGCFTLGGLVDHCWIEGEVIKDPGDLDGQGLIMVPIKILFP